MGVAELRSRAMASDVVVVVVADDDELARSLAADASALVERLEQRWSRFLATSDVSLLNAVGATGGGVVHIDGSTLVLLDVMVEGYVRTAGRFDPTRLRDLLAAGYVASIDDPTVVTSAPDGPDAAGPMLFDVEVDAEHLMATIPPGLVLDPGGVGKGLAADLAVGVVLGAGARGAMVSVGGDLACRGEAPDDSGWLVDVEYPDDPVTVCRRLAIDAGGVATSSTRSRCWAVGGESRHHQIDPVTRRPSATDLATATVVAPTGWLAEVHATAALAFGADRFVRYLVGHGLDGVACTVDGSVLSTEGLALEVVG